MRRAYTYRVFAVVWRRCSPGRSDICDLVVPLRPISTLLFVVPLLPISAPPIIDLVVPLRLIGGMATVEIVLGPVIGLSELVPLVSSETVLLIVDSLCWRVDDDDDMGSTGAVAFVLDCPEEPVRPIALRWSYPMPAKLY